MLFSIFDQNFVAGREHVVSFVGKNIGQIRLSVRTLGIVFSGYQTAYMGVEMDTIGTKAKKSLMRPVEKNNIELGSGMVKKKP